MNANDHAKSALGPHIAIAAVMVATVLTGSFGLSHLLRKYADQKLDSQIQELNSRSEDAKVEVVMLGNAKIECLDPKTGKMGPFLPSHEMREVLRNPGCKLAPQ